MLHGHSAFVLACNGSVHTRGQCHMYQTSITGNGSKKVLEFHLFSKQWRVLCFTVGTMDRIQHGLFEKNWGKNDDGTRKMGWGWMPCMSHYRPERISEAVFICL